MKFCHRLSSGVKGQSKSWGCFQVRLPPGPVLPLAFKASEGAIRKE